jgi:hypothetical protein
MLMPVNNDHAKRSVPTATKFRRGADIKQVLDTAAVAATGWDPVPLRPEELNDKDIESILEEAEIGQRYELYDRGVGVRVPVWSKCFSSPRYLDVLWGPFRLLSN